MISEDICEIHHWRIGLVLLWSNSTSHYLKPSASGQQCRSLWDNVCLIWRSVPWVDKRRSTHSLFTFRSHLCWQILCWMINFRNNSTMHFFDKSLCSTYKKSSQVNLFFNLSYTILKSLTKLFPIVFFVRLSQLLLKMLIWRPNPKVLPRSCTLFISTIASRWGRWNKLHGDNVYSLREFWVNNKPNRECYTHHCWPDTGGFK